MKRLWTIQEGALARSLYFRFSNATYLLLEDIRVTERKTKQEGSIEGDFKTGKSDDVRERLDCLDRLDDDIKLLAAFMKGGPHMAPSNPNNEERPNSALGIYPSVEEKSCLRSLLRLGYISLPIFAAIRDDTENERSQIVVERIIKIYKTAPTVGQHLEMDMDKETRLRMLLALKIEDSPEPTG